MSAPPQLAEQLRTAALQLHQQQQALQRAAAEIERLQRQTPRAPLSKLRALELIAEYPSNRLLLIRAVEDAHGIRPTEGAPPHDLA
jgi:hypothetical protein